MISHQYKFAFIHIPKAGGTSIAFVLAKYCEKIIKHQFWTEMEREIGELDDYYIFSMVRNPWDREVSRYWYQRQTPGNPMHEEAKSLSFKEWLKKRGDDPVFMNYYGAPMVEWLQDTAGNLIADYIIRLESLQSDWQVIRSDFLHIGIELPPELPRLNSSRHHHFSEYYDDECREIVAKRYEKDIRQFNYSFEEISS